MTDSPAGAKTDGSRRPVRRESAPVLMPRVPLFALAAAVLLDFCMGSLYGWSVLVAPLEQNLGASRAAVSAVYSVALVGFTVGMFVAASVFRRASLPAVAMVTCTVAAIGLGLAGFIESYATLIIGYGAMFGIMVGIVFFLCIAAVSIELPIRRSVALGLATSAFALGGLVWPGIMTPLLEALGPHGTLTVIAAVLLGAGVIGAGLLALSGAAVPRGSDASEGPFQKFFTERPRVVIVMWLNFAFLGLGGLIAVSHAAGIAVDYGLPESETYLGAMLVNLGYIGGALSAGYLSELFTGRRVMIGMAVLTAAPLFLLYAVPSAAISLLTLACLGVAFGAGTSCYPVTLASHYGVARVPAILGRVCTAYGVAGLAAPFIAGALHDLNGNYALAILIAAIVGMVGLIATLALPRPVAAAKA